MFDLSLIPVVIIVIYLISSIKILAEYDPTAKEREKVDTLRAEQFEDATG